MTEEVVTLNKFLVSVGAGPFKGEARPIVILAAPELGRLTVADALNLAAWLVAVSGEEAEFHKVYEAVMRT